MGLAKTGFPQEVGFDVSFPSTSHMSIATAISINDYHYRKIIWF